jgi:hypothetical protein
MDKVARLEALDGRPTSFAEILCHPYHDFKRRSAS